MSERRFDPSQMEKLDNPERRKALPPDELLKMIPIEKDNIVLDLGSGTGYFTIPAAELTKESVYALDVEPKMLSFLEGKVEEEGLENIKLIQGVIEDIPLDNDSVNRVIASFVLHEVEPLSRGIDEIHRVLQEGGICFCLEWEKKPMEQGPPLHHRIHSDDMKKAFEQKGFTIHTEKYPTESHYIIIAKK